MNNVSKIDPNRSNVQLRYKMYKAGKRWLFAGILFAGGTFAVIAGGNVVAADSTATATVQTASVATSSESVVKQTKDATTNSGKTAYTISTQVPNNTTSPATGVQGHNAVTNDQNSAAHDAVNDGATQAKAGTVAATQDTKVATQATTKTASTTPKADVAVKTDVNPQDASKTATDPDGLTIDNGNITINKDNFTQYFNVNAPDVDGKPAYDASTGTVTLTTQNGSLDGNVTLKNKISLDDSFDLQGQINLGDSTQAQAGGDGIAIGLHTGSTNQQGDGGDGLGLSNLPNAIGWKADTTFNWAESNGTNADPSAFGVKHGSVDYGGGKSFGAFVSTGVDGLVNVSPDQAQAIDEPDGQFKDIAIHYDGKQKTFTVNYDGKTWSENIADWAKQNGTAAFTISAATGAFSNLQQFRFVSSNYQTAPTVDVRYVTDDGTTLSPLKSTEVIAAQQNSKDANTYTPAINQLISTQYVFGQDDQGDASETYTTQQLQFEGYYFEKMGANSMTPDGNLTDLIAAGKIKAAGNVGAVTYVYAPLQTVVVNFDEGDQTVLSDRYSGQSGRALQAMQAYHNYTEAHIAQFEQQGYVLGAGVNQLATPLLFDKDAKSDQVVTIQMTRAETDSQVRTQLGEAVFAYPKGEVPGLIRTFAKAKTGEAVFAYPKGEVPGLIRTFAKAKTGEAVFAYPKGEVPGLIRVFAKAKAGEAVFAYPKGEVPGLIRVFAKAKAGEAVFAYPKGEVPGLIRVFAKAKAGEAVFAYPKGEVPDGIHVWQKTAVDVPVVAPQANQQTPVDTPLFTTATPDVPTNEMPDLPDTFGGDDTPENYPDLPDTFGGNESKTPTMGQAPTNPDLPDTFGGDDNGGRKSAHGKVLASRSKHGMTIADAGKLPDTFGAVARHEANDQPALPRTGDHTNKLTAILGASVAAFIGIFGAAKLNRRDQKEK